MELTKTERTKAYLSLLDQVTTLQTFVKALDEGDAPDLQLECSDDGLTPFIDITPFADIHFRDSVIMWLSKCDELTARTYGSLMVFTLGNGEHDPNNPAVLEAGATVAVGAFMNKAFMTAFEIGAINKTVALEVFGKEHNLTELVLQAITMAVGQQDEGQAQKFVDGFRDSYLDNVEATNFWDKYFDFTVELPS
jgi:hypothetical protein